MFFAFGAAKGSRGSHCFGDVASRVVHHRGGRWHVIDKALPLGRWGKSLEALDGSMKCQIRVTWRRVCH